MEILKLGSKGESVKKIQIFLGINPDSVYGPQTELMVKEFQHKNNLVVDGITGTATWNKMFGYQGSTKCIDPSVIYDPLKVHISKGARTIKYIVIHFTAGASSKAGSAKAVKHVFENRQASADFAVDDRDIYQFNPDLNNWYCWSVGDGKGKYGVTNTNSVSIEICSNLKKGCTTKASNHEGWTFTDEAINNALKLTKILMKKFNIDKNHVIRHFDASHKLCPGIIGWNNGPLYDSITAKSLNKTNNEDKWLAFKAKL